MALASQLTPSQRNRFIKSTRKVGMILGETPTVEGSSTDASIAPKSSFALRRPSLSIPTTSTRQSTRRLPRRPATTVGSSSPRTLTPTPVETPQRSPLSPGFGPLNRDSPFCPSDSDSEASHRADIRRKKLAKLARTFGENVPPELLVLGVIESSSQFDDASEYVVVRKSKSSQSLRKKKSATQIDSNSSSLRAEPSPSSSQVSLTSELSSLPPQIPPLTRSMSLRTISAPSNARHSRAISAEAGAFDRNKLKARAEASHIDRELAFAKLTTQAWRDNPPPLPELPELPLNKQPMTHRQGREWSGEWNQKDMGQVMNKLRSLK